MKNVRDVSADWSNQDSDEKLSYNQKFQQPSMLTKESDFAISHSSHLNPILNHSMAHPSHRRPLLSSSVQENDQEAPCCSSQIGMKRKIRKIYQGSAIICKTESEFTESPKHLKNQYGIHIKEEPDIKIEDTTYDITYHDLDFKKDSPLSRTFKKEKKDKKSVKNNFYYLQGQRSVKSHFYHQEINCLIDGSTFKSDDSILSQGLYDYKKVRIAHSDKKDKSMGIEVLDSHLISFDSFLNIKTPIRHLSVKLKRRLFQVEIKKEIDEHLKKEVLSTFIDLSLGKKIDLNNSYISWKNFIEEKLESLSYRIKKTISETGNFGQEKNSYFFEKQYLLFIQKTLIKEIMRHSLVSIFIKVSGELRNIFIPRASMSYFLNRYSDCFLRELMNNRKEVMSTKKMGGSYFWWRRLKKNGINKIIDAGRKKFQNLLENDQESIRDGVFILKNTGFQTVTDDEFKGLLDFINNLVDFEGCSGIVERACRHFYVEENNKRLLLEKVKEQSPNHSSLSDHFFIKKEEIIAKEEPLKKYRSKKIKSEGKKHFIRHRKQDPNKIAFDYFQIMRSFLQTEGRPDYSFTSQGSYDYRHVRSRGNLPVRCRQAKEIEVTFSRLKLFDSSLGRNFYKKYSISNNIQVKMFKEEVNKKVNEILKPTLFTQFVKASLSGQFEKEHENYFFWKEGVLNKLKDLLDPIAQNFFGVAYKKQKESCVIVNNNLFFYKNNLIKQILRYALFSIPLENEESENFFVSRASLSWFFNRYSDHFLNELLEYSKEKKDFIKKSSSYVSWKRSKSREIDKIIEPSKEKFKNILELDRDRLRQEVLVFDIRGFRSMTDNEFKALMDLIDYLIKSDESGSFTDRSSHHFYEKNILNKIDEKNDMNP